jgi:hypothetical protein
MEPITTNNAVVTCIRGGMVTLIPEQSQVRRYHRIRVL